MNPMTPGTAASWWLQLFGGFGTSLSTTAPAADTEGSWEGFAAVLSTMQGGTPLTVTDDVGAAPDPEAAGDASAVAIPVPMVAATVDGSPGTERTTNFAAPDDEAILHPATPSRSDSADVHRALDTNPTPTAGPLVQDGTERVRSGASAAVDGSATTVTTPRPLNGFPSPASANSSTAAGLATPTAATDALIHAAAAATVIPQGGVLSQAGDENAVSTVPSLVVDGEGDTAPTLEVLRTSEREPAGARVEARDVLPVMTDGARGDRTAPVAHDATTPGTTPEPSPRLDVFTAQQLQRDLASARTEQQTVTVPAAGGQTAETVTRHTRMDDALARLHVRRYERGVDQRPSASQRATDLGARAAFVAATGESVATSTNAMAAESIARDLQDLPELSDDSSPEGEATPMKPTAPGSPSVTAGPTTTVTTSETNSSSDDRVTGLGDRQPVVEDARPAEAAPRAMNTAETLRVQSADLGARLREAVIETMTQQARSELLASTRNTWQATVTVEPAHLGRVDLQVTRGTGGLEVVLVAAHRDAAQALDTEVDDLVDELIRRELEPAKVTVRTTDRGLDAERQPARQNPENDPTRARREQDDTTESEAEERQGRRGRGREAHDQRQATA